MTTDSDAACASKRSSETEDIEQRNLDGQSQYITDQPVSMFKKRSSNTPDIEARCIERSPIAEPIQQSFAQSPKAIQRYRQSDSDALDVSQSLLSRAPTGTKRHREEDDEALEGALLNNKRSRTVPSPETTISVQYNTLSQSQHSYISSWTESGNWPKEFFKRSIMSNLLPRRMSLHGGERKKRCNESTGESITVVSEDLPRESKSTPYKSPTFPIELEKSGGYMYEHELGMTDASEILCQKLLSSDHAAPSHTLFDDDIFAKTLANLEGENEARIVRDILVLLCPSPEALFASGAQEYKNMNEYVNAGWNSCLRPTKQRPQPDFSVGFEEDIFSSSHLYKLAPLLGDVAREQSVLRATFRMYLPFFTAESKGTNADLDIADRQNMFSHTIAVRGYVTLFQLAKREMELHRKAVTFSVTHNSHFVLIYGYYPIINGCDVRVYRHRLASFDIGFRKGAEKWTTYKFVRAVYDQAVILRDEVLNLVDSLPDDITDILESLGQEQSMLSVEQQVTPAASATSIETAAKRLKKKA